MSTNGGQCIFFNDAYVYLRGRITEGETEKEKHRDRKTLFINNLSKGPSTWV